MAADELIYFEELKKAVAASFRKTHPHASPEMGEWKGQEIVDLQEELMSKMKGRLSEKWFYTHIKSASDKLPRIDMLNMLSEYAGFKNWNDFIGMQHPFHPVESLPRQMPEPRISEDQKSTPRKKTFRSGIMITTAVVLTLYVIFSIAFSSFGHSYKCCFVGLDGNAPVTNTVRVLVLRETESPMYVETTVGGCLEVNESGNKIKFVIATPYFRPDTFERILNEKATEETIRLKTDDYALMIHYFSNSNIKDWKNRRSQLNNMIAENAKIFQVYGNNSGMELYNKKEFIDKLTLPLKSLRNVDILNVEYEGNRITGLRFRQIEK